MCMYHSQVKKQSLKEGLNLNHGLVCWSQRRHQQICLCESQNMCVFVLINNSREPPSLVMSPSLVRCQQILQSRNNSPHPSIRVVRLFHLTTSRFLILCIWIPMEAGLRPSITISAVLQGHQNPGQVSEMLICVAVVTILTTILTPRFKTTQCMLGLGSI